MLANIRPISKIKYFGDGYIMGDDDGIVTIKEVPTTREVIVLNAENFEVVRKVWSLQDGHYWVPMLPADLEYIVICRDYKKQFEATIFDYVKPAADITHQQQLERWLTWQK